MTILDNVDVPDTSRIFDNEHFELPFVYSVDTMGKVDTARRNCLSTVLSKEKYSNIYEFGNYVMEKYKVAFNMQIDAEIKIQLIKYRVGDFFIKHDDKHFSDCGKFTRQFTTVIQLSENYTGGELLLYQNSDIVLSPKTPGSIIMFSSNILHEVLPILSGERKVMIIWNKGPV